MRRFILSSLELLCTIAIFLILLFGTLNGILQAGSLGGVGAAVIGGIVGFVVSLVVCVVLFGVIFLLLDIAENPRRMANAANQG